MLSAADNVQLTTCLKMRDDDRVRLDQIWEVGTGIVYCNTLFICVDSDSTLIDVTNTGSGSYVLLGLDGKLVTMHGDDLVRIPQDISIEVKY